MEFDGLSNQVIGCASKFQIYIIAGDNARRPPVVACQRYTWSPKHMIDQGGFLRRAMKAADVPR